MSDSEDDFFEEKDDDMHVEQEELNLYLEHEQQQQNQEEQIVDEEEKQGNLFNIFENMAQDSEVNKRKHLLQNLKINKNNQIANEQQLKENQNSTFLQELLKEHQEEINQEKLNNPNLITEEEILQKILDKKKNEMKIITNKLRKNPLQYVNFTKTYILLDFLKIYYIYRQTQDEYIQSQVISRINFEDMEFLEELFQRSDKKKQKNQKDFISLISTLIYHFKKYFVYKWRSEQKTFEENLENNENVCFGYFQMLQIFIIICSYFGVITKLSYIQDLSLLDIDQKFGILGGGGQKIKDFIKKGLGGGKKRKTFNSKNPSDTEGDRNSHLTGGSKRTKKVKSISDYMEEKIFDCGKRSNVLRIPQNSNIQVSSDYSDSASDQEKEGIFGKKSEGKNKTSAGKGNDSKIESEESSECIENMLDQFKFQGKRRITQKSNQSLRESSQSQQNKITKQNVNILQQSTEEDNTNKDNKKQQDQIASKSKNKQMRKENQKQLSQNAEEEEEIQEKKMIQKEDSKIKNEIFNIENIDQCINSKRGARGDLMNQSLNFSKFNDYYNQSEMKVWVDVYDDNKGKWVSVDPVQSIFLEDVQIEEKLRGAPVLFIISVLQLQLQESEQLSREQINDFIENQRSMQNIYMYDISSLYALNILKLEISRRKLQLQLWWNDIQETFLSYTGNYKYLAPSSQKALLTLLQDIEASEKKCIPSHPYQFKISKHYIIKSEIKKYMALKPDAKPVEGLIYKDEEVYWKKDVIELNGKTRWKKMSRKVKNGEVALKQVSSIMGGGKMVDLFAIWQTEYEVPKVNDDGSLPRNEYGNFEINGGPLPKDVVYVNLPYLPRLLKKHPQIEFVEAVIGFEKSKGGMSHVVKSGVIAHKRDEDMIRKIFDDNWEEIEQKRIDMLKNGLFSVWRKLFKAIVLKKQINDKYSKIND